jgi:WD40 repeat protein
MNRLRTLSVFAALFFGISVCASVQAEPQAATQKARFSYTNPDAKSVYLAGEFNHWSTTATPMKRDSAGKWTAEVALRPGQHAYKFFVDGKWTVDPANPLDTPDGFGGKNSVITVADRYADPVVADKQMVESTARELFSKSDFAKLESMAAELRDSKARFSDGLWKLPAFYRGLEAEKAVGHASDWKPWFDKLTQWHNEFPDSITQPVVLASGWTEYAWEARGTGYAYTISDERGKKFEERLAEGRKVLEAAAKLPKKCPQWTIAMQVIALGQGWSRAEYMELVEAAAKQEPTYYDYYVRAGYFFFPRWYGKKGEWEKFAEMAANELDPAEGMTAYTRTAWYNSEYFGNLFKETAIEWPKMKQGFLDIERKYPNSHWNLNAFCRFAVQAGDRETATKLFARLGAHGEPDWQGYARYELAREWADPKTPKWRIQPLLTLRPSETEKSRIHPIAFSPDGKLIAAGTEDGEVVMWDTKTGEERWRLEVVSETVNGIAFSRDGKLFAAGGGEQYHVTHPGEGRIWNTETKEEVATFKPEQGTVTSMAFTPDGRKLAVAGAGHSQAEMWLFDLGSKKLEPLSWTKGHDNYIHSVAISPDGKTLVCDRYQSINVYNVAENRLVFDTPNTLSTFAQGVAFSPDGKTLVVAGTTKWDRHDYEPGGLTLWDTANWKPRALRAQTEAGGLLCVAISPDGKWIAGGGIDHAVHVWSAGTLQHQVAYIGHDGEVCSVAFSPDGKTLASGSLDGTVRIWDLTAALK